MAELSKNQIEYINKISKAELERKNGNVDLAIEMLNELWEGIPEPKYEYRESFLVAWSMIETAIGMKNIELMREWIQHVFKADPTRYDSGDRELWAGQVEYECENFEKSYEYFDVAKKKSSGRCFRMCDSKYKEFYLNYKKQEAVKITELSDEIYEQIEEYSEKGNQLADAGQLEQAIQVWTEGLNLIPEPQQYYGETVWFLASIGDMYFQLEQYDKACECFDKAKGNMSGEGYGNPFVMLRLGECCLELGDEKNALEYLLRAYMMEGEDIFLPDKEGEDDGSRYFEFLKTHVDLNKGKR